MNLRDGEELLHGNGIFGVARDVPTGIVLGVGEKRADTWNVFLWSYGVDPVFRLVGLVGDRQQADAMDGRVGGAQARSSKAHVVPGKVERVGDEEEQRESRGDAENQAGARRRAIDRVRHRMGCGDILQRDKFWRKDEMRRSTE